MLGTFAVAVTLAVSHLPANAERPALVDARRLSPGEQTELATLQAAVNQDAPRLMGIFRDESANWVMPVEGALRANLDLLTFEQALARWRGKVRGQVRYDGEDGYSRNFATTLAGLSGGVATERDLGIPTLQDLRGRFASKAEAYAWAIKTILPRCDRSALAYQANGLPFFRDAIAAKRWFAIDLDPLNDPAEGRLLDTILRRYPRLTPVYGWASGAYADRQKGQNDVTVEHALVDRLSRRDLMLVPADFADNLSLLRHLVPSSGVLRQRRLRRVVPAGRAYVLLVVSDGDNLQYDLNHMRRLWTDPSRPEIPLAWTVSPFLAEVASGVLARYYAEAADRGGWDEFIQGPSGYGYANPGAMSRRALAEYARKTATAGARADLRSVAVLDRRDRPEAVVRRFAEAYAQAGVPAVWLADYPPLRGAARNGMPFLGEAVRLGADGSAAARAVNERARTDRFIFVYVHAWEMSGKVLRDFQAGLERSVVPVTATELTTLLRLDGVRAPRGTVPRGGSASASTGPAATPH